MTGMSRPTTALACTLLVASIPKSNNYIIDSCPSPVNIRAAEEGAQSTGGQASASTNERTNERCGRGALLAASERELAAIELLM